MSANQNTSYLVISPHTAKECLAALDRLADARVLERVEFGCKGGDHTGYARVEAASPEEAIGIVPVADRGSARAVPLARVTADELRSYHQAR